MARKRPEILAIAARAYLEGVTEAERDALAIDHLQVAMTLQQSQQLAELITRGNLLNARIVSDKDQHVAWFQDHDALQQDIVEWLDKHIGESDRTVLMTTGFTIDRCYDGATQEHNRARCFWSNLIYHELRKLFDRKWLYKPTLIGSSVSHTSEFPK